MKVVKERKKGEMSKTSSERERIYGEKIEKYTEGIGRERGDLITQDGRPGKARPHGH
jgi:hypothetical protein